MHDNAVTLPGSFDITTPFASERCHSAQDDNGSGLIYPDAPRFAIT